MSVATSVRLLLIGSLREPAWLDGSRAERVASLAEALVRVSGETGFSAIAIDGDALTCTATEIEAISAVCVLIAVLADADAEHALAWLRRGADEVLGIDEWGAATAARRLRFAAERRTRLTARLHAYATDLATGLPHRQQLVEHLSQLLALREREPAPMALLAIRIEGLEAIGRAAGQPTADALRRKLAVRLRAGLRASDVVAAVEADTFVVLLGSLLGPADADRVAAKLSAALVAPLPLAGGDASVAVAVGISRFPEDGKSAERLLRRALALAEAAPTAGVGGGAQAANDPAG